MQALRQEVPRDLTHEQLREEAHGTIEHLRAHVLNVVELNSNDTDTLIGGVALGSILLGGMPGTGKTEMSKEMAYAIGGDYRRIQGTPDLQPSDIIGSEIWHPGKLDFVFRAGPALLAHVLLLDEANRSSPRTQSALLELMAEQQSTIAGITHEAMDPFTVFATVNPLEEEGTSPLPFAELDRFRISMSTTQTLEIERKILDRKFSSSEIKREPALEIVRIVNLRKALATVAMSNESKDYILDVRNAIAADDHVDPKRSVLYGRGKIDLGRAAQYHAIGRSGKEATVKKEDLVFGAHAAFNHRIQLTHRASRDGITTQDIIGKAVAATGFKGSATTANKG